MAPSKFRAPYSSQESPAQVAKGLRGKQPLDKASGLDLGTRSKQVSSYMFRKDGLDKLTREAYRQSDTGNKYMSKDGVSKDAKTLADAKKMQGDG